MEDIPIKRACLTRQTEIAGVVQLGRTLTTGHINYNKAQLVGFTTGHSSCHGHPIRSHAGIRAGLRIVEPEPIVALLTLRTCLKQGERRVSTPMVSKKAGCMRRTWCCATGSVPTHVGEGDVVPTRLAHRARLFHEKRRR